MREITFRAWDKTKKEYIRGWEVTGFLSVTNPFERVDMNKYIIEQYTGIKDKNGIRIFEGDIVKFKCWGHPYTEPVEYHKWGFSPMASVRVEVSVSADGDVEIIGNIHDKEGS